LKITIEERILVVPFDFQRQGFARKLAHMINFMRNRFTLASIYDLFYFELFLCPIEIIQGPPKALGSFGFAASTSDYLFDGNCNLRECRLKFRECFGKID